MLNCTLCHSTAHTRSSSQITAKTKECYRQSINVNCGTSLWRWKVPCTQYQNPVR
ncbi:ogr/Delta-like zinc finger family protein [Yersinia frederiksenii]|uniref:ogr/Delta-like zinc finger family protein n=1 Tax=Yersinia frederiksenii TaxID=29484 RepID=UPI001E657866|nr:ogr/Delta-like zinc finger family protein [Yersinia frederiksenii]